MTISLEDISAPQKTIRFPVSMNPSEDIRLTQEELGKKFSMAAAIAKAMRTRRVAMWHAMKGLEADDIFSLEKIENHPNAVLSINEEMLARFERRPSQGRSLHEYMASLYAGEDFAGDLYGRIASRVLKLSKILTAKSDGKVKLGFREGFITLIDTTHRADLLQVGHRAYPVLNSLGSKSLRGPNRGGLPNEVLARVAKKGLSGLPVDELEARYLDNSLKAMFSNSNRIFAEAGLPYLGMSLLHSRLHIFDFSQPEHMARHRALKEGVRGGKCEAARYAEDGLYRLFHTVGIAIGTRQADSHVEDYMPLSRYLRKQAITKRKAAAATAKPAL